MERSRPLALSRRYYPGFFGALFLILLRTAIGWHLLVEGLEKLNAPADKPFSAEFYLRASAGPLGDWFRSQVPDVDSREALARGPDGRPLNLEAQWKAELDRYDQHYHFTPDQRAEAEAALEKTVDEADAWFVDSGNSQQVAKYLADLDRYQSLSSDPATLRHELEVLTEERKTLEATRATLVAPINGWTNSLRLTYADLLTDDQESEYGQPPRPPMTNLDWINLTTTWGLILAGGGLILGLLTPVSALVGAGLLAMFYLSMPPWPGLPEPPNVEGHYWLVNKNLVELLACLVLASTPNGLWLGLDALIFGRLGRRRRVEKELAVQAALAGDPDAEPYETSPPTQRRNPR